MIVLLGERNATDADERICVCIQHCDDNQKIVSVSSRRNANDWVCVGFDTLVTTKTRTRTRARNDHWHAGTHCGQTDVIFPHPRQRSRIQQFDKLSLNTTDD